MVTKKVNEKNNKREINVFYVNTNKPYDRNKKGLKKNEMKLKKLTKNQSQFFFCNQNMIKFIQKHFNLYFLFITMYFLINLLLICQIIYGDIDDRILS